MSREALQTRLGGEVYAILHAFVETALDGASEQSARDLTHHISNPITTDLSTILVDFRQLVGMMYNPAGLQHLAFVGRDPNISYSDIRLLTAYIINDALTDAGMSVRLDVSDASVLRTIPFYVDDNNTFLEHHLEVEPAMTEAAIDAIPDIVLLAPAPVPAPIVPVHHVAVGMVNERFDLLRDAGYDLSGIGPADIDAIYETLFL